jgi:hypothetical protein
MSVTDLSGPYNTIFWILPYVSRDAVVSSGLSESRFEPGRLIDSVWDLLEPGGLLFVVNQGATEMAMQKELFNQKHITAEYLGELKSVFPAFRSPRFGWIVRKPITHPQDGPN